MSQEGWSLGHWVYKIFTAAVVILTVAGISAPVCARGTAALLKSGLPGEDSALVSALAVTLKNAGYTVSEIDARVLCDSGRLAADKFDLLVLSNAGALPTKSMQPIDNYLKSGGDLIALNAPMWQKRLVEIGGKWVDLEDYFKAHAGDLPQNVLFDFTSGTPGWERSTDTPDRKTTYKVEPNGPAQGIRALHVTIPKINIWDSYYSPKMNKPFPAGHTLTVFSAKGGSNTSQLVIEWDEKDGSRWMAVIALSPEWKQYILRPEDFHYWQSNPARGAKSDSFKPENAERLSVGLALSHSDSLGEGPHEYWIGPIGTAASSVEFEAALQAANPPQLDTLSPAYKLFNCHGVAKIKTRSDQAIVGNITLPTAKVVRSPHPRARGFGFDKGRDWRWIPLLQAESKDAQWRGTPATLTLNASDPYKNSVWASFGVADIDWYKSPAVQRVIGETAKRMREGIFILDGGTNLYTYSKEWNVKLGTRVVNLSNAKAGTTVRVTVKDSASGRQVLAKKWPISIEPGEIKTVSESWKPEKWAKSGYKVNAELVSNKRVSDSISQPIYAWEPKAKKSFITAKDGDFLLDGERWRAHGVNYLPSSSIGTENWDYFINWLDTKSYDPEVIQRDLEHCKEMGLNAVSVILCEEATEKLNILDLCRRLDSLGMKLNLAIWFGTPMDWQWPRVKKHIDYHHLAQNDTIFAYDVAWEPYFGKHDARVIWDSEWEKWVIERYGSIANAEKDWGYSIPRDDSGKVTNPNKEQIDTDGDWRRMTAAYRRFLDTLLYKKYGTARRLMQSADPNHLVSFRMTETANPTLRDDGFVPYDFPYLAAGVDFLAPEAYGRIGDWERVKPGFFEMAYARWAAPKEPIIWAESGKSVWDKPRAAESPELLKRAADSYENMYKLLINTRANGIFHWYYAGGYRVDELSDFGIINPDGTDRAVAKVIRKHAKEFLNMPEPNTPDYWMTIDRDSHPDGVAGVYDTAKNEYWKAMQAGHTVGLKTECTDKTSANCPMLAVGNTPWNGTNPAKYLDGAVDKVEVLDADGKWVAVEKGGSVDVAGSKPVKVRISLTNLGEAAWLTDSKGTVSVAILHENQEAIRAKLLAEVAHLGSTVVELLLPVSEQKESYTITLLLDNGFSFGEKFGVTLVLAK